MKNENVNGKSNRLRRILPLLALMVGLGLPVYVYAYDAEACQACYDLCSEQWRGDSSGCLFYLPDDPTGYHNCIAIVDAIAQECGNSCTASAACN